MKKRVERDILHFKETKEFSWFLYNIFTYTYHGGFRVRLQVWRLRTLVDGSCGIHYIPHASSDNQRDQSEKRWCCEMIIKILQN